MHDLRDFTTDRHRVVDDVPYGGGPGMVLKPEPIFRALDAIEAATAERADGGADVAAGHAVHAGGRRAAEPRCRTSWSLCGRYEGVDERVRTRVDEEISIGDYVLSGGELPALVIVDAVARLVPGVVGDEQSVAEDSFSRGLLDFPQYTRPAELTRRRRRAGGALKVPDVLLSGNHAEIRRWRKRRRWRGRWRGGPTCWPTAALDDEEQEILRELRRGRIDDAGRRA